MDGSAGTWFFTQVGEGEYWTADFLGGPYNITRVRILNTKYKPESLAGSRVEVDNDSCGHVSSPTLAG